MEAASEITTDQEDQTKDRESGGEKELTKGTGKASLFTPLFKEGGGAGGLGGGKGWRLNFLGVDILNTRTIFQQWRSFVLI